MCPKMRPLSVTKKGKKGQKFSCVKLAISSDHPRRHSSLKFCMRGRVREVVILIMFHENRSRSLGAVGGGSKIALSYWLIPLLYTTACKLPFKPWYIAISRTFCITHRAGVRVVLSLCPQILTSDQTLTCSPAPPFNGFLRIITCNTHLTTQRDGRLSWPGWMTHSGHFTREVVTCLL